MSSFQRIPPAPSWPARRNTGYSGLSPHSGRRETPGRTMHSCSGGHQTRHRLFSLIPGRRVLACRCSRAGEEKDPSKHYRIPVSFVHVQVQVLNHREIPLPIDSGAFRRGLSSGIRINCPSGADCGCRKTHRWGIPRCDLCTCTSSPPVTSATWQVANPGVMNPHFGPLTLPTLSLQDTGRYWTLNSALFRSLPP